jgi:hypothetical protein
MVAHYLLFAARRNGRSDTYPAFISATAVLNIMVVFLYWRLYFIDPALVNGTIRLRGFRSITYT